MITMKRQHGFTLIELVVVIVILGILAATALPKFIDMSTDAEKAGAAGVAGGLSSASAINYAGKALSKTVTPATLIGSNPCTEATLGALITSGWPTGYTVSGGSNCAADATVSCTITRGAQTATAGITCY